MVLEKYAVHVLQEANGATKDAHLLQALCGVLGMVLQTGSFHDTILPSEASTPFLLHKSDQEWREYMRNLM